jgi:hypothetical protein
MGVGGLGVDNLLLLGKTPPPLGVHWSPLGTLVDYAPYSSSRFFFPLGQHCGRFHSEDLGGFFFLKKNSRMGPSQTRIYAKFFHGAHCVVW